ncbi:MAG: class II fructose-bisphosphate aldolase [Planctomycetes bacterium]|nr:class II fructose-bisphosphate aldolase [Planctomycetota bacterium]
MTVPTRELMLKAFETGTLIPPFNIAYLPMMEPVMRALRDSRTFALIQVARLEWEKFEAGGLRPVRDEYEKVKDERFTRLHLDHVPVLEEDGLRVDFEPTIAEALRPGYGSVMVDDSRLALEGSIAATAKVAPNGPLRGSSRGSGVGSGPGPRGRPAAAL